MKNADERFVNLRSHVKSLSEHLSALEKTGGRLKKHQTEVVEDLEIKYERKKERGEKETK